MPNCEHKAQGNLNQEIFAVIIINRSVWLRWQNEYRLIENSNSNRGGFFTREKLMWRRTVGSIAVGCSNRAVTVIDFLLRTPQQLRVLFDVLDNHRNCPFPLGIGQSGAQGRAPAEWPRLCPKVTNQKRSVSQSGVESWENWAEVGQRMPPVES